jgi:triacylglycerol esterase/lipase EstA (alpha/beta hydrolase family)
MRSIANPRPYTAGFARHLARALAFALLAVAALAAALPAAAQDPRPQDPGYVEPAAPVPGAHFGSSPFDPPEANDQTFVVDQAGGLDTGCTFRGGGPLVFAIEIDRAVGNKDDLLAAGAISETATLRMPAFDVDFDAVVPGFNPERDRVLFNGNVVPTEWLTGSNNVWKLNAFEVPIDWVEFPPVPSSGSPTPTANTVTIEIDTANSEEAWCTAIDWASLSFEVARPVVMAHGILSNGGVWSPIWVAGLNDLGIPNSNDLDMGNLDGIGANAGKIANEVAASKTRWGVDKVVLVGHSKGGLDSRHYVENADDVEQVIQVGTPNAGSPLADKVQTTSARVLGLPVTVLVNVLAGPAGVQLTTPYMTGYNLFHGSNPNVRYTALAGDYDPDCFFLNPFCRPVPRLLLSLSGSPGDTIVPVGSVHSLGYTNNRTFSSSGGNQDATHACVLGLSSCQMQSQAIFDRLTDRVIAFGTPATPLVAAPSFVSTAAEGGLLAAGESAIHLLPIDQSTETFIAVYHPSGDVEVVLTSPSGAVIDATAAGNDPESLSYGEDAIPGGRVAVFDLGSPEVGVWSVEVTAVVVDDPSGALPYAAVAELSQPAVRLTAEAVPANLSVGETLLVEATLTDGGAPNLGASVSASVGLPGGGEEVVPLIDDGTGGDVTPGDGVYTGAVSDTTAAGLYDVVVRADGLNAGGAAYSRSAFALATVAASSSRLAGTYRDFGRDTDGDGLFNELVVEADVTVTDAGDYRLFAVLADSAGNRRPVSVPVTLAAGLAAVELSFAGEEIYGNRVDGPYTLELVRLAEEEGADLMPLDEASAAFDTFAYDYRQFQHAPVLLTGDGTATGVDFDADGLFDRLDVRIEIEVENAGFYQWSARLLDSERTEIGFASGSAFFNEVGELFLAYAGEPIGSNGVDGPYQVTDLLVFGAGQSLVQPFAFATQAFTADQFEGFQADSEPPVLTLSATPNVLWPPNHRLVEVEVEVQVIDDVDPTPTVVLVSVTSNQPDDGNGDGDTPNDVQGAALGSDDRTVDLRAERDGSGADRVYTLTYRATDAAGNSAEASVEVKAPHDFR